jgi:hypothetical protein
MISFTEISSIIANSCSGFVSNSFGSILDRLGNIQGFHFLSILQGEWLYESPGDVKHFGQYLYSAPMNMTCLNTLTVHLGQLFCGSQWVDVAYTKNDTCVPDILYPVAAMVDKMNGQELLTGTCVQISANHYVPDEFVAGSHMGGLRNDLNDALSKKPTKHGILDVDLHSELGPMATLRGLPYIETGLSPTAQSDFSKAAIYRMAYSTRTDISWLMPGLLKKVLPERFAVMLDQGTAAEMGRPSV